jgi:hypothetical protein
MHNGVQAVRDHDGGAALTQMLDGFLHLLLGFGVQRRGGFIEQDDRRIFTSARAMAMRWRWPPESCVPCSPTGVS